MTDDPHGIRNLANDPAFSDTMAQLKSEMLSMLKAEGDPRALGNGAIFDTYEYTKSSPKDYDVWLKSQDAALSAAVEKDSNTKKAKNAKK